MNGHRYIVSFTYLTNIIAFFRRQEKNGQTYGNKLLIFVIPTFQSAMRFVALYSSLV